MRREPDCIAPLLRAGISYDDAHTLRRIAMTLHRWHELECGIDGGCVEREGERGDGRPRWRYSSGGLGPYMADREKGALARLAKIMARYPTLASYVQGDPRGASLYILRPGDAPAGESAESYYSRGVAVYS